MTTEPEESAKSATPQYPTAQDAPTCIALKNSVGHDRFDDLFTEHRTNEIERFYFKDHIFVVHCKGGVTLRIEFWNAQTIRFRFSTTGRFESETSYAVLDTSHQPDSPKVLQTSEGLLLENAALKLKIDKKDCHLTILDKTNLQIFTTQGVDTVFSAHETMQRGTTKVKFNATMQPKERFFGLGDKSCDLNLRGKAFENWCTDAFGFSPESDPLYRAVPFYYGISQGTSYGIFFDNTFKTHFDFGKTNENVVSFWADGGEMNFYFIGGTKSIDVCKNYHALTGVAPLPPIWALGFHQCRWSYFPESRVREVAKEFRKQRIPCDSIYLDIDYMDNYRCFTWNDKLFPQPTQLIAELKADGFQTVLMINPGIKVADDFPVFNEGIEKNYFVRRGNGELMVGQVWPKATVFPDFTHPNVRAWWGTLYDGLYCENNVAGFWNDMNEPANFKVNTKTIPDDCQHFMDGKPANHAKAHNIYGMQMAQASFEGFQKLKPMKRPFLLTRANYAGGQRYAAVWTGDNVASWQHLGIANRQIQRLSASGFSFAGSDIGGFVDTPTGELMVRWLQMAIFHPLMRIHSMGNNESGDSQNDNEKVAADIAKNRLDQEPWSFGNVATDAARKAIELRYQLLPYIYSVFAQHTAGYPMTRSLAFVDQTDERCLDNQNEFMFGDDLLVSPITQESAVTHSLYLPQGKWFFLENGGDFDGGERIMLKAKLERIPVFVRAGATIPMFPVIQHTGEIHNVETMTLKVFFTETNYESQLFEDEGDGFGMAKITFFQTKCLDELTFQLAKVQKTSEGEIFEPNYMTFDIEIIGLPFSPNKIFIDDKKFEWTPTQDEAIRLRVDKTFQQIILTAQIEKKEGWFKKVGNFFKNMFKN